MLATFPVSVYCSCPTAGGCRLESTAAKLTALVPPSTSRREVLAALDDMSSVRMHYRLPVGPHHSLSDRASAASTRFPAPPPNVGAAATKPQEDRTRRGL